MALCGLLRRAFTLYLCLLGPSPLRTPVQLQVSPTPRFPSRPCSPEVPSPFCRCPRASAPGMASGHGPPCPHPAPQPHAFTLNLRASAGNRSDSGHVQGHLVVTAGRGAPGIWDRVSGARDAAQAPTVPATAPESGPAPTPAVPRGRILLQTRPVSRLALCSSRLTQCSRGPQICRRGHLRHPGRIRPLHWLLVVPHGLLGR